MKHIAPQSEIRWPDPEPFRLESLKEVDAEKKPTETKTEPERELWPERLTMKASRKVEVSKALRVWWIPQVPGKPFRVNVQNIQEAKLILKTLAEYDAFQFEHRVKPDYCNAGGLEELGDDGEWSDWYDDDGNSIDHKTE